MDLPHTTLMVQGTTSDAGKSTLVAGLGRILQRRGFSVAPFKPQNMALNSAVTADGGEIGRAQAVQAEACGVAPSVHMNPILIKPSSDTGAQVIVQGHAIGNFNAGDYHDHKPRAMAAVLDSYEKLRAEFPCVLVEGAGSPAEINLREGDIANMGFAEAVDCPVILVTDIDRGGSFAHLVGTLDCLSQSERNRVCGFVINRFRGDIKLLMPGVDWLEERTGIPVLGVVPYLQGFHLEAEDAITSAQRLGNVELRVCVVVFPRISNHTDFDTLRLHPSIDLHYVGPGDDIPPCDLIILPGSKAVRQDLQHLRDAGWDHAIKRHLRYGGKLLGVCGGYQMLGRFIDDPNGVEGVAGCSEGLELLNVSTTLEPAKTLKNVSGKLLDGNVPIHGYEIHMGVTEQMQQLQCFATLNDSSGIERYDGACSDDDQVRGTYIHGLFDGAAAQKRLLEWVGLSENAEQPDYAAVRNAEINRLADTLESSLDLTKLAEVFSLEATL